jgi:hypothetical protein
MSELIFRKWNNREIRQRADGYLSATDMCASCGKMFGHWNSLKATSEYLQALEQSIGIPIDQLVQVNESIGLNNDRGTWVHRRVAIRLAQWLSSEFAVVVDEWVEEILLKGKVDINEKKQIEPQKVTDETVKIHGDTIRYFTDSGDIQLAALLKNRLGNLLLAEQQQQLTGDIAEQLEGVVEVALRLGFQVPKNYECTLGKYVKQHCAHLARGMNQRYSYASSKQVPATMYPANNPEVEGAVLDYCVTKAFRSDRIKLN